MAGKELEYRVKVDAGDASRDLRKFGRDAERAGKDVKEALEDTSSAADKAAKAIVEMGTKMDAELRDSAAAADALATALGPELTARMDVDQAVIDLQRMGLTFDEIRGDADKLAGALKQVDGIRLQQVNEGLGTTRTRTDDIGRSAQGANSALANMIGNTTQSLGGMFGLVGDIGVGIGQMGEYAADAALGGEKLSTALGSMAKVAGPIAAMSLAFAAISKFLGEQARIDAWRTEQVEGYAQAIDEVGIGLGAIEEHLGNVASEAFEAESGITEFLIGGDEIPNVAAAFGQLGVNVEDVARTIRAGASDTDAGKQALAELERQLEASGVDVGGFNDLLEFAAEQQDAYAESAANAAAESKFWRTTTHDVEAMVRALQPMEGTLGQFETNWQQIIRDIEDGGPISEKTAQAVDYLAEALGITADEVVRYADQRLAEELQAEEQAAADASAKFDEMVGALREAREAAAEYQRTIASEDWGAAALEAATGVAEDFAAAGHADARMIADTQSAMDDLAESTEAAGEQLLNLSTPEGRASLAALDELGASIVPAVAQAFDDSNGDIEAFGRTMDQLRKRTIRDLAQSFIDLGDDEDTANQKAEDLVGQLSAIPEDIETFYRLAGDAEAKAKLELLQGSIDALPENVQTTVTQQIILGDYQGALATINNYYTNHPASAKVNTTMGSDKAFRNSLASQLYTVAVQPRLSARGTAAGAPSRGGRMVGVGATTAAAPAAATTVVSGPTVTINAGVVGNRYDMQRIVARALRGHTRIGGRR